MFESFEQAVAPNGFEKGQLQAELEQHTVRVISVSARYPWDEAGIGATGFKLLAQTRLSRLRRPDAVSACMVLLWATAERGH